MNSFPQSSKLYNTLFPKFIWLWRTGQMWFWNSTKSQVGASFTPSREGHVRSEFKTNLKVLIVQVSPILYPWSNHTFGFNLHLKHHLVEENYIPNNITENTRSPVKYKLSMDRWWLSINIISSINLDDSWNLPIIIF